MSTTTLAVNLYEMDYILLQGPSNRKFGLLSQPRALARLSDPRPRAQAQLKTVSIDSSKESTSARLEIPVARPDRDQGH
ncbi:hypothetical protein DY000_02055192 [Brassica cretica]|uniref:Uncharacterized protein n=1 Tax=Brassica cretica TaxID=69181 RepID=A0ABQ7AI39_BRACR|nr:hypothetical protein DY000_02055192 [Brassica cretica]